MPGWNTYVDEKHDATRKAYLCWLDAGKPKFGYYFDCMTRTRAVFKLALRYCKQHEEELKANACAVSLFDNDPQKFWNNVYKMSNSKVSCQVASIGGASGPQDVTDMWRSHFQQLYSSTLVNNHRSSFLNKLTESPHNSASVPLLSVHDIEDAVISQKRGKAAGPDGLHIEAFIFGGPRLRVHLSFLFNLFLRHGYVPDAFCQSIVNPLVKFKSGNLSDVNNYRAIALANSVSKILH